jgi:hypothetical protein
MYRKRTLQERFWEVLPGLQFWSVFVGAILLSYYHPVWAAMFIIIFDLYWVLKALNVALHLVASYRKFRLFVTIDWLQSLERLTDPKAYIAFLQEQARHASGRLAKRYYEEEAARLSDGQTRENLGKEFTEFYHLIILPFVDESFEVLDSTLQALTLSQFPQSQLLVVLATEERAGEPAQETARRIKEQYAEKFYKFFYKCPPRRTSWRNKR